MRKGRRLGFDVGAVRTGVAVSSDDGIFASPIGNIAALEEVPQIVAEYCPIELYVGLPLSLSGKHTASTNAAILFAKYLAENTGLPVRMIDERLTTSSAASLMRAAGKNSKKARPNIDAAAATLILEQALAMERSGTTPGQEVGEYL